MLIHFVKCHVLTAFKRNLIIHLGRRKPEAASKSMGEMAVAFIPNR